MHIISLDHSQHKFLFFSPSSVSFGFAQDLNCLLSDRSPLTKKFCSNLRVEKLDKTFKMCFILLPVIFLLIYMAPSITRVPITTSFFERRQWESVHSPSEEGKMLRDLGPGSKYYEGSDSYCH